jgi:hypothetical protein
MGQGYLNESSTDQDVGGQGQGVILPSQGDVLQAPPTQQVPCPTCAGAAGVMPMAYVYALGRILARFPRLSVEKEFAQAAGRADTAGKTDPQVFHEILSMPENRYLVRQMCWVFAIQGLETYILQPRNPADFDLLVGAIRPAPSPNDIDIVVGMRGPIAPPEMCNGLMVPIVVFDQIYSFSRDALIKSIPKPKNVAAEKFGPAAEEVFDRIMQMTDNAGATDEHRALNYLAMRYPGIYANAADEFARDFSLSAVEVRPSTLSGTRKVLDGVFSYTNRNTDVIEKSFVRVDVTEEFPFLVTKLQPYFDR